MELLLKRTEKNSINTIGDLSINGTWFSNILEDVDRGLYSKMSAEEISKLKIYGKTAIPTGKYKIVVSYSPRFKKMLPLLLNVPGYAGIRIHPGNTETDTEGCLLPGLKKNKMVVNSRSTYSKLEKLILEALKKEEVTIEIL